MATINCYKIDVATLDKIRIPVKQYLNNVSFAHIQLSRRTNPIILNEYEIDIKITTIDNRVYSYIPEIINSSKGIIGLKASSSFTSKFGEAKGEIHIKKAGDIIYVLQFFIDVKKSNLIEESNPEQDVVALGEDFEALKKDIGNINNLTVENVADLVSAVNKVNRLGENSMKKEDSLKKEDVDRILSIFNI